jgi:enoyl-CoA hydratase/carnithine racemase
MASVEKGDGPVRFEMLGAHVALVTLNRPDKRNAINPAIAAAMEAIIRRVENTPEIRVVLLTSSEPRVFCAGADLAAVAAGQARDLETPTGGFAGFVFANRMKPWIAVVEGLAVAGGFEICLACDMIVASQDARFGLPEVKRGLMAGAGGVHRLASALPRNIANEVLATGDTFDAQLAYRVGLVNRLAPAGEALAAARQLAESIAVNAPLAVQHTLATARESQGQADGAGRSFAAGRMAMLRGTEDFKEGPRAFVEKRDPVWTGR